MKKLVLLTILMGVLPLSMMAQDDMYFTPKKGAKEVKSAAVSKVNDDKPVYHSGSNRNVDEYNRRGKFGSYFEKIGTDSLGNDIIEFHSSAEDLDTLAVYPYESVQYDPEDDYTYSRRMNWFDDFYWYDPWFFRYSAYSPYFYGHWGLWDPFYYSWYDPWYSPYYYGWYGPWAYNWYGPGWGGYGRYRMYHGWGLPSYHYSYGGGVSGTRNHGYVGRAGSRNSNVTAGRGHFGGYRGNGQTTRSYDRSNSAYSNRSTGRFGGSRSNSSSSTRSYTPSYSGGSYGGGGGSFGGSSSGGGGSRSGGSSGGGHFGGRR